MCSSDLRKPIGMLPGGVSCETTDLITEPKNGQKLSLRSFEIPKHILPGLQWTLLTLRKHFTVISGLFTGAADPIKVFGGHFEGYWVELRLRNGPQRY